jgi:hypothetical protein
MMIRDNPRFRQRRIRLGEAHGGRLAWIHVKKFSIIFAEINK